MVELKDEPALMEARQNWKIEAQASWKNQGEDHDATKQKKLCRKPAHAWILATDRQMMITLGVGYNHFLPVGGEPPSQWPLAVVAMDEGSDGVCATNYLIYNLKAGLVRLREPHLEQFHRLLERCGCVELLSPSRRHDVSRQRAMVRPALVRERQGGGARVLDFGRHILSCFQRVRRAHRGGGRSGR